MQEIKITRAEQRKEKPDSSKLVFGKYMTCLLYTSRCV